MPRCYRSLKMSAAREHENATDSVLESDYTEDYGERMANAPRVDGDFNDRIGDGMRLMERGAFTARKVAGRFLRKFSASLR